MQFKFLLLVALLAAGCGTSEPSRFYLLTAEPADTARVMESGEVRLGVQVFQMPQYLLRPNIVTIPEGHRLEIAEYDRWAESLDISLQRVLAVNLAAMIPGVSVYRYPWRRQAGVEFEVEGEVLAFALEGDGKVHLEVAWTLVAAGKPEQRIRRFSFARAPAGTSYGSIVETMNTAVAALSEAIAVQVERARSLNGN